MSEFVYNDSELQMDTEFILCIEEHTDDDVIDNSIDTRLFIGYSSRDDDFYVRGKRQDIGSREFVPYAFRCVSSNDLYDFIEFALGNCKRASVVLYNFNNLDGFKDDELTYDFFERTMDRNYEVAAYDGVKLKRGKIIKYLRMLRNMYNWNNSY